MSIDESTPPDADGLSVDACSVRQDHGGVHKLEGGDVVSFSGVRQVEGLLSIYQQLKRTQEASVI